jgi:hypothetical protein
MFFAATKAAGTHTLKFGTDLRTQRESCNGFGNSSGLYQFNTNWTRGRLDNAPAAPLGQDIAAFVMGMPTGGSLCQCLQHPKAPSTPLHHRRQGRLRRQPQPDPARRPVQSRRRYSFRR